jgi:hypothetical protein
MAAGEFLILVDRNENTFLAEVRRTVGLRRGGAVVPCDDGVEWNERSDHRRPRSDKGSETTHGAGTNL